MVWPCAIVLSGWAGGTLGQLNVWPPALTAAPGVRPSAARP
jgi:hypothetical protein